MRKIDDEIQALLSEHRGDIRSIKQELPLGREGIQKVQPMVVL